MPRRCTCSSELVLRLVRVGTMHITTILRYDNTDEKPEKKNKKNLKKPYLFFLFNDILAVVKERKEFNEAAHSSLRGKKTTKGINPSFFSE